MPIYKKISPNIQQVIIDNPVTPDDKLIWTNIANAGKKEIEYLRKKYNFSLTHLHASSAKAVAQRTKIEIGEDYTFMILHYPVLKNNAILPTEVEFFIGRGYLITLHNNDLLALNNFFNLCKKDGDNLLAYEFESSSILLYELLEKLLNTCYALLDKTSIDIGNTEKLIFAYEPKKAVSDIMILRLSITNFRKIMQNHKNVIQKLMQRKAKYAPAKKIKKYYISLIEHAKRIWENLETQKETIEILNNTNESLLNYRISDIMKTLTIFSVIVFPLTLLAAIFGMNITGGMPFAENKYGFWIIIIFMLVGCLGMIIFFAKKKWL